MRRSYLTIAYIFMMCCLNVATLPHSLTRRLKCSPCKLTRDNFRHGDWSSETGQLPAMKSSAQSLSSSSELVIRPINIVEENYAREAYHFVRNLYGKSGEMETTLET
jgi:hypothetical protein